MHRSDYGIVYIPGTVHRRSTEGHEFIQKMNRLRKGIAVREKKDLFV